MKYFVDFQYLPKGHPRPSDDGEVIGIETDDKGYTLIPNVGDYVQLSTDADHAEFSGRVKTRLFRYFNLDGTKTCAVNIVVEEIEDDAVWGALIKE